MNVDLKIVVTAMKCYIFALFFAIFEEICYDACANALHYAMYSPKQVSRMT